ncbi:MAG: YidC/Oxa1 family membrane protein insertase [Nitrospira sp.]
MSSFFHTIISVPLYNGLIFLMHLLPFFDAGVIIIIFTIIVKMLMLPLSIKMSKSQLEMKSHEKALNEIKEKHKDNKEEHARRQMEYYKEHGINPFASILIILIQFPLLIGLYRVFLKSGLPKIDTTLLYSFVSAPAVVNMMFLGIIDISGKSLTLAVLVGITTYFQTIYSAGAPSGENKDDIAKAFFLNMKYILPLVMAYVGYIISGAIALYLITSNLFAIGQEIYIKRKYHKKVSVI